MVKVVQLTLNPVNPIIVFSTLFKSVTQTGCLIKIWVLAYSRSQNYSSDKANHSTQHVYDRSSSLINEAHLMEPTAAPDPARRYRKQYSRNEQGYKSVRTTKSPLTKCRTRNTCTMPTANKIQKESLELILARTLHKVALSSIKSSKRFFR